MDFRKYQFDPNKSYEHLPAMFGGVVYIYDVDSFYIPSRVGDPKNWGLKTTRGMFGIGRCLA